MEKQDLRERAWDELDERGVARFPFPPHGRIPNFAGADRAADRLAQTDEWNAAYVIKANPDAPQRPVRENALRDGKIVYMAVPRLRDEACFIELDPDRIEDYRRAATIAGSSEHGIHTEPDAVKSIDLVVSGSVAVTKQGARVGKGEGYSDLEYAILRDLELISPQTVVVTTVHELQILDEPISVAAHDVPMDLVVTPDRVIRTHTPLTKPNGIDWNLLTENRYEAIPVLENLRS